MDENPPCHIIPAFQQNRLSEFHRQNGGDSVIGTQDSDVREQERGKEQLPAGDCVGKHQHRNDQKTQIHQGNPSPHGTFHSFLVE